MNLEKMQMNHQDILVNTTESASAVHQDTIDLCAELAITLSEIAMYAESHKHWKVNKGRVNESIFYNIPQTQREGVDKPKIWCAIDDQASVLSDKYAKELTLVDKASDFMYHLFTLAKSHNVVFDDSDFVESESDTENVPNASNTYLNTLMYIFEFKVCSSIRIKFVLNYILGSFKEYVKALGLSEKKIEDNYLEKYHIDLNVPLATVNLVSQSDNVVSDSDLDFNSLCENLDVENTVSKNFDKSKFGKNAFLKLVDR